jgi:hypothetical protein
MIEDLESESGWTWTKIIRYGLLVFSLILILGGLYYAMQVATG